MNSIANAIIKIEGPSGTGKSRTLVREAVRRIKTGEFPAESVKILTAGSSHIKRLENYLEIACQETALSSQTVVIETFEQFCLNILQTFSPQFAPDTQLLSEQEAHILLRHIGQSIAKESLSQDHALYFAIQSAGFARSLYPFIRQFQTFGLSSTELEALFNQSGKTADSKARLPIFIEFQRRFLAHCQAHHLMSYRDLTEETEKLLASNTAVRQRIQQSHGLLLIDEAQELSQRRFQVLSHLYPETQLIFAGNERLSLTEFRGAAPHYFADLSLAFGKDAPVTSYFPPHELTCYRNNEALLWWIGEWLETQGYGKKLWAIPNIEGHDADYKKQIQSQVHMGYFNDPEHEAQALAQKLKTLKQESNCSWQDMVILLRNINDGNPQDFKSVLIQVLSDHQIPVLCNGFPESLQGTKILLFHALSTFEQIEKLSIKNLNIKNSEAPHNSELNSLSKLEKTAAFEALNQHLVAWLSFDPALSQATDLLNSISSQKEAPNNNLAGWLILNEYAQSEHPLQKPIQEFIDDMGKSYQDYQNSKQLFPLAQSIIEHARTIHDLEADPTALQVLGRFLQSLKSLDEKPGIANGLNGFSQEYPFLWSRENKTASHLPEEDAVEIKSIQQVQGDEFSFVFIPSLTGDSFPQTAQDNQFFTIEISQALRQIIQDQGQNPYTLPLGFDHIQHEKALCNEAQLMALAVSRTKKQLFLSSHKNHISSEGRQELTPISMFFNELIQRHPTIQAKQKEDNKKEKWDFNKAVGWLTDLDSPSETLETTPNKTSIKTESRLFHGHGDWSQLAKQEAESLYSDEEILSISPSGISNYIQCPRKFFYAQVLNIRTDSGKFAAEGTFIHKLLETLNLQFPEQPYNATRLKELTEALFNEDKSLFKEEDFLAFRSYSPIARSDLKTWIMGSIDDLEQQGYFSKTPQAIKAEQKFKFQVKNPDGSIRTDLSRVEFNGKIDALIQYNDSPEKNPEQSYWEIIDYKTSRSSSKFQEKTEEKRLEKLMQVFHPIGSKTDETPEELSHDELFSNEKTQRNYQIPIYHMAAQQDSKFKNVHHCGLQVIRPQEVGKISSVQIMADSQSIEENSEAMLDDLSKWVTNPILEASSLPSNAGTACDFCNFVELCDDFEDKEERAFD